MSKHGLSGLVVEVRGRHIDAAIRLLQRKVKQEGVLTDYAKHEFYEKPSDIKRRKKKEAIKRNYKMRMEQLAEEEALLHPNKRQSKKKANVSSDKDIFELF